MRVRTWDVLQCEITGEDDARFPPGGGSGEWARAGSGVGMSADGRAVVVLTNSGNGPRVYERVIVSLTGHDHPAFLRA